MIAIASSDESKRKPQEPSAPNVNAKAPESQPPVFPDRFQPVPVSAASRSSKSRRAAHSGMLLPTGLLRCTTAGTDSVQRMIREKFADATKCGVYWALDQAAGEVAGRIVSPSVIGVTPIRVTTKGLIHLYLHGLFEQYPDERPTAKQKIAITQKVDEYGSIFFIHLNIGLRAGSTGKGNGKSSESKSPQNSAEQSQAQTQNSKSSRKAKGTNNGLSPESPA